MIRYFVSISSIFIVSFIPLYKSYLSLYYIINKNDIEKQFCINKNKPYLNCHGKCFLSLRYEKIDKSNANNNLYNKLSFIKDLSYYSISNSNIILFNKFSFNDYLNITDVFYYFQYVSFIFHPPSF